MRKTLCALVLLSTVDAATLLASQTIGPYPSVVPLGDPTAYRNLYIHVPASIGTYILFTAGFLLALAYLVKRDRRYEERAHLFITTGLLVGISALITGAVWAYESWGSPWNWDPRETGVLMMILSFSVYLAIRSSVEDPDTRSKISMAFAVASYATVPLSFSIPYLMPSLHPTFVETSKFVGEGLAPVLLGTRIVIVPLEASLLVLLVRSVGRRVVLALAPVVAVAALIIVLQAPLISLTPTSGANSLFEVKVLSGSFNDGKLVLNVSQGGERYVLVYHGEPPITPPYVTFKGRRWLTLRGHQLLVDGTLKNDVIEAERIRIVPYWGNLVNSLVYALTLVLLGLWAGRRDLG